MTNLQEFLLALVIIYMIASAIAVVVGFGVIVVRFTGIAGLVAYTIIVIVIGLVLALTFLQGTTTISVRDLFPPGR